MLKKTRKTVNRTIQKLSGAEMIVKTFLRNNVKHTFVFPGGTIAPILDVIEKKTKIKIICPRNEQGAGYAAIAYAKLTGKPAVFMVTSGPGVTNAVTPVADAYYDNVPLVIITGQVGVTDMRGSIPVKQRGFQEVDTVDIFKSITKEALIVRDVRELPRIIEHAFVTANRGRKGPVLVDLPMNVQREMCNSNKFFLTKKRNYKKPMPPRKNIELLARWVREAKRPVILAGGGAIAADAGDEVRKLATRWHVPVVMSLPGIGVYPSPEPLSLGMCGYAGSQHANLAIYNADLLICIGTTLHVRQTGSLPNRTARKARIARIDIDQNELDHSRVPINLKINADAREATATLNAILRRYSRDKTLTDGWQKKIEEWKTQYPLVVGRHTTHLRPQRIIELVDRVIQNRWVIVTTGVGQHQMWVSRHFNFDYPTRQLLTSSGHGTMGFDLPAAIGAKIAHPNATVLCFVGDGSFQMNIQELATVAELKLDIKIIVLDNHSLNIVAQFQRQNWKSHPTTGEKYNPDFAKIAHVYGIYGVTIKSRRDLPSRLATALRHKGPVLIHCHIDPKEDLLPMLLGGHTLDDMTFKSSFS